MEHGAHNRRYGAGPRGPSARRPSRPRSTQWRPGSGAIANVSGPSGSSNATFSISKIRYGCPLNQLLATRIMPRSRSMLMWISSASPITNPWRPLPGWRRNPRRMVALTSSVSLPIRVPTVAVPTSIRAGYSTVLTRCSPGPSPCPWFRAPSVGTRDAVAVTPPGRTVKYHVNIGAPSRKDRPPPGSCYPKLPLFIDLVGTWQGRLARDDAEALALPCAALSCACHASEASAMSRHSRPLARMVCQREALVDNRFRASSATSAIRSMLGGSSSPLETIKASDPAFGGTLSEVESVQHRCGSLGP